jgi:hypothetical protein
MTKASIKQIANSVRGHKESFQVGKTQASKAPDVRFGLDKEAFVITGKKPDGRFTTVKVFPNGDVTERHTGEKHATKMPNQHSHFADSLAGCISSKLIEVLHVSKPCFSDEGICLCGVDLGFHS